MDSSEEQRIENEANKSAKVPPQHAVKEEAKQEFLRGRCDGDGENDDHDAAVDRARGVEKLDDGLFARTAAESTLCNGIGKADERVSRNQQRRASQRRARETRFRESGKQSHMEAAQPQKTGDQNDDAESEHKILGKDAVADLLRAARKGTERAKQKKQA